MLPMLYVLAVQVNDQWEEIARFDATDNAEALRAALHHLPREYYGTPIALNPFKRAEQSNPRPNAGEPDAA